MGIFKFDCNKLKLEGEMNLTYDRKPCRVYFKTVWANVIRGHHLKRNIYLQIMSIGISELVRKIFGSLMNLTNERNNRLNFFADSICT